MVALRQLVSWLDVEGPTSAPILASACIGGDPGDFLTASIPSLAASSSSPFLLVREAYL